LLTSCESAFAQHRDRRIAQIRPTHSRLVRTCQLSSFMVAINGPIASPMRTLRSRPPLLAHLPVHIVQPRHSADTRDRGPGKDQRRHHGAPDRGVRIVGDPMSAAARPRP